MPDYKPNQFVRAFAVLALIAALVLVVSVVATSGGGGGDGDGGDSQKTHLSKTGQRAVDRGVWIVRPGDTLGAISLKTGIDETTLQTLNPDIDPQTLLEGQRIALR
jgi:LysM repeat protein